ncbi:MAG: DUF2973 domain-containing protein [Cyanophyceae cyanobacterium]
MLHLLYLLAFSGLAAIAIGNLIRNMMVLGTESQRHNAAMPSRQGAVGGGQGSALGNMSSAASQRSMTLHPEMLDENGRPIREPLLVMKSMTVDDARDHLDALFQSSPENSSDSE